MVKHLEKYIVTNMKIIDGLKLPGWQVEIPDCSRDDFPEFFKEMGFKVGAEIGVYVGGYSEILCKAGLKLYSIDPWFYPDNPAKNKGQEICYRVTQRKLRSYDCTVVRKTSMEAVKDFADGSLDFVYIDANHAFKYITEDIWEWSKKVKTGGVISGHDYVIIGDCHVQHVVDAYTKALGINKWYVLGRSSALNGEKRDKHRSWFWIKQ